jgi:Ca2+-binding RTX toxin-like protein
MALLALERRAGIARRKGGVLKAAFLLAGLSSILLAQTETAVAATAFVAPSNKFANADAVHFVADPGETNHVTIDFGDPSEIEIRDTGATITPGSGCTSISPNTVQCADPDNVIEAVLGDGDDFLSVNVEDRAVYDGGDGDDRIDGGSNSFDSIEYLFGGAGNDTLLGRRGDDVLDGGAGADLMSGGTSSDCETAGLCRINNDTVTYAGRVNRVRADADIAAADDGERDEGDTIIADVERIVGGKGNDVLGGITTNFFTFDTSRRLVGMVLEGRAGNDILRGTRAPDSVGGGPGDDLIRGGGRADSLSAGRGDDRLVGDAGQDRLRAGRGQDVLFARDHQRDRVNGGPGRDRARIDEGLDRVTSIAEFF